MHSVDSNDFPSGCGETAISSTSQVGFTTAIYHPDIVKIASAFAPMPGGVGPMTRAMLLSNVVEMAQNKL